MPAGAQQHEAGGRARLCKQSVRPHPGHPRSAAPLHTASGVVPGCLAACECACRWTCMHKSHLPRPHLTPAINKQPSPLLCHQGNAVIRPFVFLLRRGFLFTLLFTATATHVSSAQPDMLQRCPLLSYTTILHMLAHLRPSSTSVTTSAVTRGGKPDAVLRLSFVRAPSATATCSSKCDVPRVVLRSCCSTRCRVCPGLQHLGASPWPRQLLLRLGQWQWGMP